MEWVLFAWPTLLLLGLGVRVAVRLHYGARGPDAGDPIYVFLNSLSWVLLIVGLAPLFVGGAFSIVGLIVVLVAAATFVEAIIEQREAQRRSMCTLLALTVEQREQLDSSILLEGQTGRGIVGRAAEKLFDAIHDGTPLAAAIDRNPAALPREATAYVAAGQSMRSESAALKELSHCDTNELATVWGACVDRMAYLTAVLLIMSGVFTFLLIKIVPEFRKIFEEFDLELPAITRLAMDFSAFVVRYFAMPLAIMVPVVFLSAFGIGICYLCDLPVLRWLGDRLFRSRHKAYVLRILAVATESRQSLATVLERLAGVYPSKVTRRQLRRVAGSVAAGQVWRNALCESGFVSRAEQNLLGTAEEVGNLPWALRSIAKRKEKRAIYRMAAAVQVLYPCVILLLGALVGFTVTALFLPLVKLIEGLSK